MNVLAVVMLARLGRRLFGSTHERTSARHAPPTAEQAPGPDAAARARIIPEPDASGEAVLAPEQDESLTRL